MKKIMFIASMLLMFGCFNTPTNPPSTPPPPVTVTEKLDTTLLKNFSGSVYFSPTYVKVTNEDPEQFVKDTSRIGISDSLLIVVSTSINTKLYVKGVHRNTSTNEKMYFADFQMNNLKDTVSYDAVLYFNAPKNTIQFHYEEYAFFFYDVVN